VVYPTGEGKQWTPDGKGVVILGGAYEAGNVDDIEVDLATGKVTRVTANLDYDEDMDFSPNEQWIAIGSTRGLDALTPMTRIVRPNFLPAYVSAPVYDEYASRSTSRTRSGWSPSKMSSSARTVSHCSIPATDTPPEACPAGIPPATRSRSGSPALRTRRSLITQPLDTCYAGCAIGAPRVLVQDHPNNRKSVG
jgi:hypothetical protein